MTAPDMAMPARKSRQLSGAVAGERATFAPALTANRGAVLNLLTILARVNLPFMGSYCASKARALSLTQDCAGSCAEGSPRRLGSLPAAIDTE